MIKYLSVYRIANYIKLRRSTFDGTFLLIEGSSDKTFYQQFVDELACELVKALQKDPSNKDTSDFVEENSDAVSTSEKNSSKQRAIDILEILDKSDFQGVLAIVDADFDNLETVLHNSPNLLCTDTHDLETMLIQSPALEKVLAEFGSEEKIAQFNRDVRLTLLEAGISVGYLLWISLSDGLNLSFEKITFSKFIDEKTLQIDELKLIREVKNKSQSHYLKDEDLQQRLITHKSNNHDSWQVCCGHDLVQILSFGLCKALGTNNSTDVKKEILERSLRLAYEEVYFCKTQLYFNIRTWESKNQPFKVLRNNT